MTAAKANNFNKVAQLLTQDNPADPNIDELGLTPLYFAALHPEGALMLELLIRAGADKETTLKKLGKKKLNNITKKLLQSKTNESPLLESLLFTTGQEEGFVVTELQKKELSQLEKKIITQFFLQSKQDLETEYRLFGRKIKTLARLLEPYNKEKELASYFPDELRLSTQDLMKSIYKKRIPQSLIAQLSKEEQEEAQEPIEVKKITQEELTENEINDILIKTGQVNTERASYKFNGYLFPNWQNQFFESTRDNKRIKDLAKLEIQLKQAIQNSNDSENLKKKLIQ